MPFRKGKNKRTMDRWGERNYRAMKDRHGRKWCRKSGSYKGMGGWHEYVEDNSEQQLLHQPNNRKYHGLGKRRPSEEEAEQQTYSGTAEEFHMDPSEFPALGENADNSTRDQTTPPELVEVLAGPSWVDENAYAAWEETLNRHSSPWHESTDPDPELGGVPAATSDEDDGDYDYAYNEGDYEVVEDHGGEQGSPPGGEYVSFEVDPVQYMPTQTQEQEDKDPWKFVYDSTGEPSNPTYQPAPMEYEPTTSPATSTPTPQQYVVVDIAPPPYIMGTLGEVYNQLAVEQQSYTQQISALQQAHQMVPLRYMEYMQANLNDLAAQTSGLDLRAADLEAQNQYYLHEISWLTSVVNQHKDDMRKYTDGVLRERNEELETSEFETETSDQDQFTLAKQKVGQEAERDYYYLLYQNNNLRTELDNLRHANEASTAENHKLRKVVKILHTRRSESLTGSLTVLNKRPSVAGEQAQLGIVQT